MSICTVARYSRDDRGILYNYILEEFNSDEAATILYQIDTSEYAYVILLNNVIKGYYCYSIKPKNRVYIKSCYVISSARRNRQVIQQLYRHASTELYKYSKVMYIPINNYMCLPKKYCNGRYIDIKRIHRKINGW